MEHFSLINTAQLYDQPMRGTMALGSPFLEEYVVEYASRIWSRISGAMGIVKKSAFVAILCATLPFMNQDMIDMKDTNRNSDCIDNVTDR
jgi:hypothetical protein